MVGTSTATCLPVLHGLEGGTQCDFGFAEAHVAADEAVHRHGFSMSDLTSSMVVSWSAVS